MKTIVDTISVVNVYHIHISLIYKNSLIFIITISQRDYYHFKYEEIKESK